MTKYLLPVFLFLSGCVGSARQTHLQVADAISQSINTVAPRVVDEYKLQLRACRVEFPGDLPKYRSCADGVNERWSHFRSLYRNVRNLQDTYARALEANDPNIVDYVKWMNDAWCQLGKAAPFKMPEVPGVTCHE